MKDVKCAALKGNDRVSGSNTREEARRVLNAHPTSTMLCRKLGRVVGS